MVSAKLQDGISFDHLFHATNGHISGTEVFAGFSCARDDYSYENVNPFGSSEEVTCSDMGSSTKILSGKTMNTAK